MRIPDGELPLTRALAAAVAQRQVAGILQRDGDDSASHPLTDAQVKKAISFYNLQPQLYTFAIRLQIQDAVGIEPTPAFDEETVQAVAVWQRDNGATPPEQKLPGTTPPPPLAIDGMAGPRTLPRMFESGLNVKSEGLAFGKEAQAEVIDKWRDLTPTQRAVELVKLVNVHLAKAGVPPVIPDPKNTGLDAGAFVFQSWHMEIGLPALSEDQPDVRKARDTVDTIYHEARHAEQWFRMAQLRAMQIKQGSSTLTDAQIAAQIVKQTQILPTVVAAAVKTPMPAGSMNALIAQGWFDSVYGAGGQQRNQILHELEAAGNALEAAKALAKKHPTPANKAALQQAFARNHKANVAYKNLPEENDAWATGPMTGPGVTSGAPSLPPLPPPVDPALDAIATSLQDLVGVASTV